MKKTIISVVLALVIVGLGIWLYLSIMEPVKFDNEYTKRRDACAEKLKAVRTLEEAYKSTYGKYCGSFDTLFDRLINEDSMRVISKDINYAAIPADVDVNEIPELEAVKKGYIIRKTTHINPIVKLLEDGKFAYLDPEGKMKNQMDIEVTPEMVAKIQNLRYVPYPTGEKYEFTLQAGSIDRGGFLVPVFECKVELKDLLKDLDNQLVINKIAELDRIGREPVWKVGSMTESVVDGNFE